MVIKLQPTQIAALWDAIKLTLVQSNNVPDELQEGYTVKALENLLSGKYECWVLLQDDEQGRQIVGVAVTSIIKDPMYDQKYIFMHAAYGFRRMSKELAFELRDALVAYGGANACKYIKGYTNNERVKQLNRLIGAEEIASVYCLNI
jgi:hypothetical protein